MRKQGVNSCCSSSCSLRCSRSTFGSGARSTCTQLTDSTRIRVSRHPQLLQLFQLSQMHPQRRHINCEQYNRQVMQCTRSYVSRRQHLLQSLKPSHVQPQPRQIFILFFYQPIDTQRTQLGISRHTSCLCGSNALTCFQSRARTMQMVATVQLLQEQGALAKDCAACRAAEVMLSILN
jgi:hypothetical protein